MATETLRASDRFPVGTTVNIYRALQAVLGAGPSGAPLASGVVAADGSLTLTDLPDASELVAYALVDGRHNYVRLKTEPAAPAGVQFPPGGTPGVDMLVPDPDSPLGVRWAPPPPPPAAGGTISGRWTHFALTEQAIALSLIGSQDQCACYDASVDRTFVAFRGSDARLGVLQIDHTANRVDGPFFVASPTEAADDVRGVPSMCIANDGTLVVVFGAHDSKPVLARSKVPRDVRRGWTITFPSATGTLHQLAVNRATGWIYMMFRAGTAHGATYPSHEFGSISRSTNNGATWTSFGALIDTHAYNTTEPAKDFYPTGIEIVSGRVYFCFCIAHGTDHDGAPDGVRSDVLVAYYDTADLHFKTVAGVDQGTAIDTKAKLDAITVATRPYAYFPRLRVASTSDIGVLWKSVMNDGMIGVETAVWGGTSWNIADTGSRSDYMFTVPNLRRSSDGWEAYCPAGHADRPPRRRVADDAPGVQFAGAGHDLELLTAPASGSPWQSQGTILRRADVVGQGIGGVHHVRDSSDALKMIVSPAAIFAKVEGLPLYAITDQKVDTLLIEGRQPRRVLEEHHDLIIVQADIAPLAASAWRQHDLTTFVPDNTVKVLLRVALTGTGVAGANGTVKLRRVGLNHERPQDADAEFAVDGARTTPAVSELWVPLSATRKIEVQGFGNLATYGLGLRAEGVFGGEEMALVAGTGGGLDTPPSVPTAPPVNVNPPTLSPDPVQTGQVLTVNAGTWSGNPSLTLTYQFKRGATNIAADAADPKKYTVVAADEGQSITVVETADNGEGTASATSKAVVPTAPPPPPPPSAGANHIGTAATTGTKVTTRTITVPAGGVAVGARVIVTGTLDTDTTITVTDSKANVYATRGYGLPAVGTSTKLFLADGAVTTALVAGDIITITAAVATNFAVAASWWTGIDPANPFGGLSIAQPPVVPAGSPITLTGPAVAVPDGGLALGIFSGTNQNAIVTPSAGFTDQMGVSSTGQFGIRFIDYETYLVHPAATVTPSATFNTVTAASTVIAATAYYNAVPVAAFTVTQDKATRVQLSAAGITATAYSWKMDGVVVATTQNASVLAPSLGVHNFSLTITDASGTRTLPSQDLDVVWSAKVFSGQGDPTNATSWNPDPPYRKWTKAEGVIDDIGPWPSIIAKNRLVETPPVQTLVLNPGNGADVTYYVHLGDKGTAQQATGDRIAALFQPSYGGPSVNGGPSGSWHYDWVQAGLAKPIDILGDHGPWVNHPNDPLYPPEARYWRFEYRYPTADQVGAFGPWNTWFEFRAGGTSMFSLIPQVNRAVKVYGKGNQLFYQYPVVNDAWVNFVFEYVLSTDPTVGYFRVWRDGVNILAGVAPGDADGKVFYSTLIDQTSGMTAGAKCYHGLVTTNYTARLDMRKVCIGKSMDAVMAQ
jgi:hypothetical protein